MAKIPKEHHIFDFHFTDNLIIWVLQKKIGIAQLKVYQLLYKCQTILLNFEKHNFDISFFLPILIKQEQVFYTSLRHVAVRGTYLM